MGWWGTRKQTNEPTNKQTKSNCQQKRKEKKKKKEGRRKEGRREGKAVKEEKKRKGSRRKEEKEGKHKTINEKFTPAKKQLSELDFSRTVVHLNRDKVVHRFREGHVVKPDQLLASLEVILLKPLPAGL